MEAGRAVFSLTYSKDGGYVIRRAKYADEHVKQEYELVMEMVGGQRPWVVDMYAGVSGGWLEAAQRAIGRLEDVGGLVGAAVLGGGDEPADLSDGVQKKSVAFEGLSVEEDELSAYLDAEEEKELLAEGGKGEGVGGA